MRAFVVFVLCAFAVPAFGADPDNSKTDTAKLNLSLPEENIAREVVRLLLEVGAQNEIAAVKLIESHDLNLVKVLNLANRNVPRSESQFDAAAKEDSVVTAKIQEIVRQHVRDGKAVDYLPLRARQLALRFTKHINRPFTTDADEAAWLRTQDAVNKAFRDIWDIRIILVKGRLKLYEAGGKPTNEADAELRKVETECEERLNEMMKYQHPFCVLR